MPITKIQQVITWGLQLRERQEVAHHLVRLSASKAETWMNTSFTMYESDLGQATSSFFLKDFDFYLLERQTAGQRKLFHPLIHSPNTHNSRGRARPKTGAGNSTQVSTCAIILPLGCALAGSGNQKGSQDSKAGTLAWAAAVLSDINCSAKCLSLPNHLYLLSHL